MELTRLHVVGLITHEVNVARRDDIRLACGGADIASLCVGDAGKEVDQPPGDARICPFQIHEHGVVAAQVVGDLSGGLKLRWRNEHDLELFTAVEIAQLMAMLDP